jgi:hypothetical protein
VAVFSPPEDLSSREKELGYLFNTLVGVEFRLEALHSFELHGGLLTRWFLFTDEREMQLLV